MIKTASFSKMFSIFRRGGSSLFTYDCAHCGKAVRGKTLCPECEKTLVTAENKEADFAAAYYYETAARSAVLKYKFSGNNACMDMLCDWLAGAYRHFENEKIDFAVPVPSYKIKETRLFELAKEFCVMNEIPFEPGMLMKIRKTAKQHDLSAEERKTNLKNAFEALSEVSGKTVLLIDDIITTGTTAAECSKALYEKGAEKVLVLTVLKTHYTE